MIRLGMQPSMTDPEEQGEKEAKVILHRAGDGSLYEPHSRHRVDHAEFRARLQSGQRLRVRDAHTGADCTIDALLGLLAASLPPAGLLGFPGSLPGLRREEGA